MASATVARYTATRLLGGSGTRRICCNRGRNETFGRQYPANNPTEDKISLVGLSFLICAAAAAGSVTLAEGESDERPRHYAPAPIPPKAPKRRYTYVVLGGGTAACAAIESILNLQSDADILMLTESDSGGALAGRAPDVADPQGEDGRAISPVAHLSDDLLRSYNEWRRHITSRPPTGYDDPRSPVTVLQHHHIRIDVEKRRVSWDDGSSGVYYDKLLMATAGRPREFYVLDGERTRQQFSEIINTLETPEDFQALEALKDDETVKHVTVIGGGFLGSEIALALARQGKARGLRVSQVYAEAAPMQRLLPAYLAHYLQARLKDEGIEPIKERLMTDLRFDVDKGRIELVLQGWEKQAVQSDYIVLASTHIEPRTEIAEQSGLEVDKNTGGVVVNAQFEAIAGVYAAGGAASYFDAALGRRRIDRYDHSINSGLLAGYNMAASVISARAQYGSQQKDMICNGREDTSYIPPGPLPRNYTHQPMLRSHLGGIDVCLEGLGEIDARLRTVGLWLDKGGGGGRQPLGGKPVYRRGLVYYLRGDRIVGILLWNTTDLLERAREVIRSKLKVTSVAMLKQQIPLAPDDWLRMEATPGKVQLGDQILTPPF